ncbi:MAG TPA: cache domain-containing protein [Thermoanaerobaculia bacterium]|nr:cache domain-containing protein [Thermoanaerobaculia bacterium]
MTRKLPLLLSALVLIAAPLCAKSFTPKENTHAAIKAYVVAAARHVARYGPDCAAFAKPEWRSGDYYIFVDAPDNTTLCHPNASLIGKNSDEIKDVNGKSVGIAIREAAAKEGGGWADYMWPRPGTDTPVQKSTFVTKVKAPDGKTYVVGSGGYEVK